MLSNDQRTEKAVDKQAQNELKLLNRSMIDKATEIVTNNEPASDLWPQFRQVILNYKSTRSKILESQNPKPELSDPETKVEPKRHDSFNHTIPEEDIYVLWPLLSTLENVLKITPTVTGVVIQNEQASISRSILSNLLVQGELLYQYAVRAVIRIFPDIVVKINKSCDTTEVHVLHHIHEHSQNIPAPIPFGMIKIGKWSYTFISFIQGVPLDRIWGDLTTDRKCYVREKLNAIFTELRRLPGPSKEGYLGGGTPPICKGGHRFTKISSSPIVNETQFNSFLLDDSWLEPAQLQYVQMSLPSDHRIVMTHGDLCPLNILVESEHILDITGVVDWETGGAYPEYWEYVNAFKSSFNNRGDWCLYLPEAAVGRYFDEYARYCAIGRFAKE
ncbi:hypothetical protein B0J11DRAFT_523737 [Dendryphion nanum]|uniref:Aminoglycoside phosphotransferase domain-containing protein n=1 Tax=Dendryphion nanum TaxID=256645 RepID=A0A9P9ISC8_9PLEO|nr:hypothetical protein B0J11DRAFT_523737 [Dendryphion nanum]